MTMEFSRRQAMALGAASFASVYLPAQAEAQILPEWIQSHDAKVASALERQVTDPQSRWCGGIPDNWGLYHCGAAAEFLKDGAAAHFSPQSAYHLKETLRERMKLAADFLLRFQRDSGNIDLLVTNFDSPPDTGFVVHKAATAARLAQMHGDEAVLALLEEFLRRAGAGMAEGGIHTPNHRWVVCSALAQIHELFPDGRYVRRIDAWLAEGIDIDEEGQFLERSTAAYNTVVDRALIVMAHKLNRPELLDPVRKNLDAMAYLLHPNGEVVTEISRRQDSNTRATMRGYWFPLRYMALRDKNGVYASMLRPLEPAHIDVAALMEYPGLQAALPEPSPVPDDYEKHYPLYGMTRIRRGKTSATILHTGSSRWFSLRRGEVVVNAVRFASAFFGKGQFVPDVFAKDGDEYVFTQALKGWYFQPITDPDLLPIPNDRYARYKLKRKTSEICEMSCEARIRETARGFEVDIRLRGTDNVPLAVEVNLGSGGELTGVDPAPHVNDAFLLKEGFAECRHGPDGLRFGPGRCEHGYVLVRGAEAKLAGPSVYLTGYTPFEHTLVFEML